MKHLLIVQLQKMSILPPQRGLEFPGGGHSVRPKHFERNVCIEAQLDYNFQRDCGGRGGGGFP